MSNPGRAWGAVELERAAQQGQNRKVSFPHTNRILIMLTFWEGDRTQALQLARFLADLEPEHTELADLLLVNRFDCAPPEHETLVYLSRKFNVGSYTSTRCETGWPNGCNGIVASGLTEVKRQMDGKRAPAYKAIFNCEADGAPCIQNWISEMSKAWDAAEAKRPTYIAGPLVQRPAEHINANFLVSCDPRFLGWLIQKINSMPRQGGWDFVLARDFRRWGWADIPRMRSYWQTPTFGVNQYMQAMREKLIWLHGVKDASLINHGREYILGAANGKA